MQELHRAADPSPAFLPTSPFGTGGRPEPATRQPASDRSIAARPVEACVLVVDDQIPPTDPLVRLLTSEGFRVDCAATGSEALVKAAARAYVALVLDLCLPDMPGLLVLARLRARGNNVPVLVLTGFGDLESACAAGRLGAARFMSKPVFLDLGAALREIAGRVGDRADARAAPQQPDPHAAVETLAIAALLERLHDVSGANAAASAAPAPTCRDAAASAPRRELLAVLLHAVADPGLPVPCFTACADVLRRVTGAEDADPPHTLANAAQDLIVEVLGRPASDSRVTTAIDRIRSAVSARRRVSEDEIAQDLGVHPSHVGRILKAETGLSFRRWRSGFVMKAVVRHLVATGEQVAQIAYHQLGYEHPSQLDREFHETFGCSPREFRRLWHAVTGRA